MKDRQCVEEGRREVEEGSSFMYDHYNDVHSNDMDFDPYTNFSFEIIETFRDPLTRQLNEAARIQSLYNEVNIDLNM